MGSRNCPNCPVCSSQNHWWLPGWMNSDPLRQKLVHHHLRVGRRNKSNHVHEMSLPLPDPIGRPCLDTILFSVERNLATLDLVSALLNSSSSSYTHDYGVSVKNLYCCVLKLLKLFYTWFKSHVDWAQSIKWSNSPWIHTKR